VIGLNSSGTEYHKVHASGNQLWAWIPDSDPSNCVGCPNAVMLGEKVRVCTFQEYITDRLKESETKPA